MSALLQTAVVGACLAGAAGYLLYRLGVFELLGLVRRQRGGHCSACPGCPTAEQIAERLAERK
jgi:hypothetical protein